MNQNVKKYTIFFGLLILTLATSIHSGMEWIGIDVHNSGFYNWENFKAGLTYALVFLGILTIHEFGHYTFAKLYKADVTLPYYIPMWLAGFLPSIGTMGAFIKIKSPLRTRAEFFDVGVAGPLAGFVAALGCIIYGFMNIPDIDYLFQIHPDYKAYYLEYGKDFLQHIPKDENALVFSVGDNLLFFIFKHIFLDDPSVFPASSEVIHYPWLFAGYLACFVTALNMIPIGQLDGGHVVYGLIGYKRFNKISPYIYLTFIFYGGLGIVNPGLTLDDWMKWPIIYVFVVLIMLQRSFPNIIHRLTIVIIMLTVQFLISYIFPSAEGYYGYLAFAFLIGRFLGVKHPPSLIEQDIGLKRKIIGIIAIIVFILCFSPVPFLEG